mmetsp:Transcript_132866/g.265112  ORF Transcript_132866/g.265112 Transcript_132866/m.265112 type:complete len:208 (+) Transcript_132866:283-906(+)
MWHLLWEIRLELWPLPQLLQLMLPLLPLFWQLEWAQAFIVMVFLLASFVTVFARVAYLSAMRVSSALDCAGEQFTNMSVFEEPPKASCMSCVNVWFRYGTCLWPLVRHSITSPSAVSDLLISMASFCMSPETSDFFRRSDPAKSHIRILPRVCWPVSLQTRITLIRIIKWDRELSLFMAVAATVRCLLPRSNKSDSSSADSHCSSTT